MTLRVGQYTAVFTGCDGSHHTGVAVCAGRGTVCQKPTLGISVENPNAQADKCEFHCNSCEYLGYMPSPDGLMMAQNKIQAIQDWLEPPKV